MKRPPSRQQAYTDAARVALIATLVVALVIRLLTPMPFPAILAIATMVSISTFALLLRMTPIDRS